MTAFGTDAIKVAYVMGTAHSGSTLLTSVLGQLPFAFAMGEFREYWSGHDPSRRCGCGVLAARCPTWQPIFDAAAGSGSQPTRQELARWRTGVRLRHVARLLRLEPDDLPEGLSRYAAALGDLYRAVAATTGARLLVDADKSPAEAAFLRFVPGIEPHLIHLVRDPRAVAYSWQRRRRRLTGVRHRHRNHGVVSSSVNWLAVNHAADRVAERLPTLRLPYEEFTADPRPAFERVARYLDEDPDVTFADARTVVLSPTHTLGGSRGLRFRTGSVGVVADEEWRDQIGSVQAAVAGAITAPLRHRYASRSPNSDGPIAILVPSLAGGGAERCAVNLSAGLARAGADVDLVVVVAGGPLRAQVDEAVRFVPLDASRVMTALPAIVRYLRRRRPRVVLSLLTHLNLVTVLASTLSRVDTDLFLWEHNTLSEAARRSVLRRDRLAPWFVRRLYPRATAVVAVSEGAARDLVRTGRLRRPPRVLPNPVITQDVFDLAGEPVSIPDFATDARPAIVALGRLGAQKDFATLLRAFALTRQERDAALWILGEGPERAYLERLASELGVSDHVHLPGFVDNPYPFLRQAAVVALSSLYEGLPTVLVEALALGCDVVATDCPSGPRELLGGGRWGRLVPVGDPGALSAGMVDALNGRLVPPQPSAWKPYTIKEATDAFLRLIREESRADR